MSGQTVSIANQALALAGVAQFALYANDLATEGRSPEVRLARATHAIVCTDPDEAMDVYGDRGAIADGLRYLRVHLSGQGPDRRSATVARYIGQILKLSGKLLRDPAALERLRVAIEGARHAEIWQMARVFNDAYRDNISPMRPQIMLQGTPAYLKDQTIQCQIRTQLLAAVRCGVMWRQCGGGFLSLFLRRKALLAALP